MNQIKSDVTLDAKGLACPMPIVKTKKAINGLEPGQVIEVQATDKGSKADLKAWAESTGHQYIGTIEEGEVLKHYLRKSSSEEAAEKSFPHVLTNEELEKILKEDSNTVVLDVREEAEYAFSHIPGAVSIPLGELKNRLGELDKSAGIHVVCRTGSRSDLAAQQLQSEGFEKVTNVVPGMSSWTGETTSVK
ncbi:sulfurtransferase TusA family protein [Metabacillus sp. 113a]|uniref:sulfurtransferase TusA family protein n=1 Tax=Metabacillus sp. 113a TaxID=3404706 RepID=UPI003CF7E68E